VTTSEPIRSSRLGFLDGLGRLFRKEKETEAAEPGAAAPARFQQIEAELDATLAKINERLAERRAAAQPMELGETSSGPTPEERRAAQQKRMGDAHQAIRADIVAMHERLGTGVTAADLDAIAAFLGELEAAATAGRGSHEMLPRMRYAIAAKVWHEAGELAVARLVALLQREKLPWPDPIRPGPTDSPEDVERARQRRLREVREGFLAFDFARSADRLVGVIRGWRGDYPGQGSPLWEECVLEGVATGIRGKLALQAVEILRRDRDRLLAQAEESIGAQLASLRAVVAGGVDSIDQATQAVATTLRVLDEAVPGIAWEHVCTELPAARGEPAA
jgi:hypothetical protein